MLNIRKRFFLLLTIVGLLFGIAACTNNDDYVRLSFDNDVYEVKVGQTIDVTPIVNKGSNVGAVTIEYTSYDDQIASYSNGKLQGLRVGETVIKVVCSEKPVAYDVATVRVVANSLPEVEFEPLQQNMLKGTTQTLKYHFVPEYGNALMSFTSANPEIATIDENGVITGVAKGTAVIIARATDELDSSQYRDYTFVVEVLEADFAITYELNGGTNDPTNPAGYNVLNLPIILKDATKLGHNFVGWYDNPEFSGSPITEIAANSTGDMTLYAKWEVSVFDITYELNGGINASENPDSYDVNKLPLVLGEPTKTGYNFLGWYLDDEKIDSIVEGTTGEIKLVAQWEIATYNITFDLVGGSWQDLTGIEWPYNRDRNQMVADFIVDFNKHSGKTVAADGSDFFARSWMADGSSAGYKFLTSTEYGSKWGWLLDFINDNRLANGKTALNENDNQAEARGELHNFLNACAPGDKGGNASYGCDYSTEEGTTGFWLYMVDLEEVSVPKTYTVESEDIILPEIAYKMGYTFLGWFLNGEKVEKIVKGTTGDLNFVAEWEIVEYTIEYNLNGGLFDIYLYSSREEMVDDFLTDAMAYYNKDKKPNCMVDDSGTQVGFANVFTAIYGIFSSEEYGAKWAWLKEYIIYTATDAKASLESGSEAYWRYSLGAFLFEDHRASWPASADYTNDELANGFWSLLLKEGAVGPQYTYTVNDEVILLTPTKEGSVFLGWFLNGEKIEKISKGTTGNLVLEAKWYNPDAELDIEYQLDGGVLPEGAPTTFVAKDGLAILPTPIKVGYMFKGWYEDIECTKEVTSIASGRSEGVVLYALWELETYKIEYETNGGEFLTDSVAPLYATFDELVLEFINDYSSFTGISGITAESFYGKSNQYGLYGFFKNEEMATKWNWLLNFVADMATEVGYSGKAYLMLSAGAANFNKYSRSNFAAFLQQTHLTKISPISMNFENVDSEALWAVCPTKDIQIGIEAQYEYTILDLPLELATPNKEGATFIGWYTNSDLKNGKIDKLTVDNIGNIKLYARWSDSTIHFDTFNIHYELDGGILEEGAPTSYVEETGVALKGATRPGYTFQGWYLDAECTKGVTEITAQDKGDITLYACWEAVTYTVTYEVGEGALPVETVRVSGYDNLEQIIEDLLKDYSSYTGVTYNTPADLGTSAWPSAADRNFGTFYLSNVNGVNMYEKYAWFLEYLLAVNTSGEYPRILVKYKIPATCKEVDDETYAFYYAFKGFVQAMQYRSGNAYWETANYADEAILNKALDFAPDAVYEEKPVSAEFTLETLPFELPIPTAPEGQKFVGWYQNSEFTGSAISAIEEGTIGDQTLYAKYESSDVEVKHSIEYVLNGATLSENAEVQYIQGVGLLITATAFKEGYEFKGWYLDSNYSKEITKIDENSIGKVTLYAKLVIKTFEIHLVGTDLTTPLILEYGALLPTPVKEGHIFKGWYDNPECVGEMVTVVTKDGTYYACWEENIQAVKFESSDTSVATVDNKGLITAVSNGTVTIKMTSLSPSGKTDEFTFEVYSPDHFDINYETNSYVEIGKSILLLADYVKRDGSKVNLVWSSLTPEIASVDAGAVTGLKAGQAVIRVALADDANIYQDFVVTVLDSNLSDALKYVLSAHESNAFLSYDLGIGAGTPAYYRDIVGSVSKLLYNEPLTINDQYYATANANEKNHGGKMSSIEFITVHYTGNMAKGSTASANANYFATNTSTSIHYVTGNDGVFSVLDDSYVAYHAGDGTSVKFEWFPTGVTYKDGDPVYPIFGITANSKFSINGTETTISVPEGTTAATKKVTDSKWINDMGLAFKIVDGQYYMGTTWWCYSQVAEGRICSKGGNLNSIGIESAVNPESNLWYTWQRTAQLVAKLMLENDLDITRVKGHHFYSAKDCPQPLLENDLEIWWKFIEMVEHEYDMLTKYKDYQFTFELDTETTAVNNNGRVVEQPLYTEVVTYTVTIDNGTTSETITLSTIVEGMYCK